MRSGGRKYTSFPGRTPAVTSAGTISYALAPTPGDRASFDQENDYTLFVYFQSSTGTLEGPTRYFIGVVRTFRSAESAGLKAA